MEVIIIGAGLSGLTAAALLRQAGASVEIVEADRHIGGRIRAVRDPVSNRALADLGPTWVWPKYQPGVARWIERLGIATFEQFNDGDAVITGYGPAPFHQPVPGQDGMVRIAGGPSAFIDALSGIVGTARIRTSATVTGISEHGPNKLQIHLGSGEILTAGKVIVSVPLRVAALSMDLPWAPASLLGALSGTPTWMSSQAKAVALYERPFWRDAGLSGRIVSRNGPLFEAHDHCSADNTTAAIFGFVSWSPEQRKRDPEGLRKAILDQLSASFGKAAGHPLELVVQDWAANSRIATRMDLSEAAQHPDLAPALLRQPHLGGRLRFAVSEVSEISPGLIEGALAAGEQAASELLGERL